MTRVSPFCRKSVQVCEEFEGPLRIVKFWSNFLRNVFSIIFAGTFFPNAHQTGQSCWNGPRTASATLIGVNWSIHLLHLKATTMSWRWKLSKRSWMSPHRRRRHLKSLSSVSPSGQRRGPSRLTPGLIWQRTRRISWNYAMRIAYPWVTYLVLVKH